MRPNLGVYCTSRRHFQILIFEIFIYNGYLQPHVGGQYFFPFPVCFVSQQPPGSWLLGSSMDHFWVLLGDPLACPGASFSDD